MPVALLGPADALPPSHVFLSIARGRSIRTVRVRLGVLRAGMGALLLLAAWLVASSLYLASHDSLVAALIAREAATQYAYEDRIAALRGQVEHESSLKLVGQTALEGKLRSLGERAAALEQRAGLLADIGARTGLPARAIPRPVLLPAGPGGGGSVDNPAEDGSGRGPATSAKPHPDDRAAASPFGASGAEGSFAVRLAGAEERLERIDAAQYRALGTLGQSARARAGALRGAIESVGLSPERLMGGVAAAPAAGGPYVPLDGALGGSAFGQALAAMRTDIAAATALSAALPRIPFAAPLTGSLEVTSPFGARLDPFLGRAAMHTGVDLADGYGTEVRATAAGRVVSAGPAGGYGTMVEVDHGHGLVTRYAHLSRTAVAPGEAVGQGEVVGEVGATGRATGPHLHYETRIDGEAVDPVRFINAAARLAALDSPAR